MKPIYYLLWSSGNGMSEIIFYTEDNNDSKGLMIVLNS